MSPAPQSAVLLVHERDLQRHETVLQDHGERLSKLEIGYARLSVYAATGAFVGGGLVAGATALVFELLKR